MARRTKADAQATRDKLLDTAEQLFLEQGVARTSLNDIAVAARQRVMQRHRVLNLMTHVDPWKRPDLDHAPRG